MNALDLPCAGPVSNIGKSYIGKKEKRKSNYIRNIATEIQVRDRKTNEILLNVHLCKLGFRL